MKKAAHNIGSLKIENNPSSLWNGGSSSPSNATPFYPIQHIPA